MVSKGFFPNVTTSGRQYNIGEMPSVIILYTYINLHAGTPKLQSFLSKSPGLLVIIWSYTVVLFGSPDLDLLQRKVEELQSSWKHLVTILCV